MYLLALVPVVLVADVASQAADRADARSLSAILRRQLESEGIRVVTPPPASALPAGAGASAGDSELSVQIVVAAIAEARKLSASFEESRAIAGLERAEVAYRRAPAPDPRPLIELLLLRARIQFDLGLTADARTSLRRVAALDPERRLDPGEYEPRLLSLWNAERKSIVRTQSTLVIEGEGQAIVDGAARGAAPQTVKLPAGEHFVCLGGTGGRTSAVEVVALANGITRTVRPAGAPAEARPRDLRAAARAASAGAILEASLHREASEVLLEARLYDVATGRTLATARGAPEIVAALLARALLHSDTGRATALVGSPAAAAPAPSGTVESQPRPFYTRWWFWTLVGVAVAGTAAAVIIAETYNVDVVVRR